MLAIITIMAVSLILLPTFLTYSLLGFLPFLLWGATGWSSQAPQQHTLLSLQPDHGAIVVALNSSSNYLGSAIGAGLGGLALSVGFAPRHLPYLAGGILVIACIFQLMIVCRQDKKVICGVQ